MPGSTGLFLFTDSARERDCFDSLVFNQLAHTLQTDQQGLKDTVDEAGPMKNLLNGERTLRNI